MKKTLKNVFIFILILLLINSFTASYRSFSIDNLAFVVALAIDKSNQNKLKVSFQFTTPSSVSETGSTEKSPSIINTIEASSIDTAINIMNAYLGKEINLSHCKVIVFSEELAKQGISDEIYSLINNVQVRPSANIVVSKCDAKYYIENSKPSLESLITKYYEVFPNSSQYTGFTSNATIGDFFNALTCDLCQPYAILGGINASDYSSSTSIDSQKDYTIKSNESPISGKRGAENIGLAVFKDDTLVGELNALETISFLCLQNNIEGFLVSVPDPEKSNSYLDLYLSPSTNTKVKVSIINGSPFIEINIKFSGKIRSISKNSKYLSQEILDAIASSCNHYLESHFLNYLYRTSIEFKSDVNGIGKYVTRNFLTTTEFNDYKWKSNYQNSSFSIKIDTTINSGSLLTQT